MYRILSPRRLLNRAIFSWKGMKILRKREDGIWTRRVLVALVSHQRPGSEVYDAGDYSSGGFLPFFWHFARRTLLFRDVRWENEYGRVYIVGDVVTSNLGIHHGLWSVLETSNEHELLVFGCLRISETDVKWLLRFIKLEKTFWALVEFSAVKSVLKELTWVQTFGSVFNFYKLLKCVFYGEN